MKTSGVITREVFWFASTVSDHYNTRQSDMYRTLWTPITGQYFVIYKNTHVTKL